MSVVHTPPGHTHEVPGTRFTSLATPSRGSTETSVWLVEIDAGTKATPHELSREEVFVVLEGAADVLIGDERSHAARGDAIVVPPGVPFELQPAAGSALRALCCLPVGGRATLADGSSFAPPWSL
jgi:mannose-6-phosphate isomerase-like protein (cupin superfamily)